MRAMILAAGRGSRMRPLTDSCPKPLLRAGQYSLIEYHIMNLVKAGINEIIINHAWLGEQIVAALGNGSRYSAKISYSAEDSALETAAGIANVLSFFQDQAFLVINGDIWTDWNANNAFAMAEALNTELLANLVLVDNPEHNPLGDFQLLSNGIIKPKDDTHKTYTFAGIGVYHPELFKGIDTKKPRRLAVILKQAMLKNYVCGVHHNGLWFDIGTPARLDKLNKIL